MAYISKVKLPDSNTYDIKDARLVLDNGKISSGLLPDFILGQMLYGGTWNATNAVATLSTNAKSKLEYDSNTLTLVTGSTGTGGYTKNEGIYYITSVSGTFATETYEVGDWLVATSAGWKKIDNTDAVSSVNGKTGVVVLNPDDVGAMPEDAGLNDLSDVTTTNPSNGQVLTYNGSAWVNLTPSAQVNADWNATSGVAQILNKPAIPSSLNDLSDVYTTGVSGIKNILKYNVIDKAYEPAFDYDHKHGNITASGAITTNTAIQNGDRLVFSDANQSNKLNSSSIQFGTATNQYLANNGTWQTIPSSTAPGTLTTSATTSQTEMANESLSGNVILHKVSKTGKLNDLVDVDLTSTGVAGNVMIVDSSLSARTTPVYIHTDGTVELPESKGIQFVADQNDTIYTTLVPNNSAPRDGNTVTVPAVDGTILTDYSTVSSAYGLSFSASQEEVKYNTTDNKLYVDKTIFEGTITYNNGTYTCDKTYVQLLDAYQKGQVVRVKYSYQADDLADMCGLYYLSNVEDINSDPELVFTLSDPTNFRYTPPTEFTVISNNTWSSRTVMPLTNANVGTIPTSSGYTEVKYSTADGKLYSAASPETAIGSLNTTFSGSQATSASESFGGTINLHKVSKTGNLYDLVNVEWGETFLGRTNLTFTSEYTPTQIKAVLDNNFTHFYAIDGNSGTYVPVSRSLDYDEVEMYFHDVNASGDLATYCVKSSGNTWTVSKHESPKRFVVHVTEVDDGEGNMTLSPDKTVAEIWQAYNSNSYTEILCDYNSQLFQLTRCIYGESEGVSQGMVEFISCTAWANGRFGIITLMDMGEPIYVYNEFYMGTQEIGSAAYLQAAERYSPSVGAVPVLVEESGNSYGVLPYNVYGNDIKTSVFSASTAAEMRAHSGTTQGDICLRTDTNSTYIRQNDTFSGNWIELLAPQADWNQTGTTKQDYIKNKPTIPTVSGTTSGDNWTSITINGTTKNIPQGGGGATALSALTDTTITTPTNGQVLTYDSSAQKWVNSTPSGGGLSYVTVDGVVLDGGSSSYYFPTPLQSVFSLYAGAFLKPSTDNWEIDDTKQVFDGMVIYSNAENAFYVYTSASGLRPLTNGIGWNSVDGIGGYITSYIPLCDSHSNIVITSDFSSSVDWYISSFYSTDFWDKNKGSTHTITVFNPTNIDVNVVVVMRGASDDGEDYVTAGLDTNNSFDILAGGSAELNIFVSDYKDGVPMLMVKTDSVWTNTPYE